MCILFSYLPFRSFFLSISSIFYAFSVKSNPKKTGTAAQTQLKKSDPRTHSTDETKTNGRHNLSQERAWTVSGSSPGKPIRTARTRTHLRTSHTYTQRLMYVRNRRTYSWGREPNRVNMAVVCFPSSLSQLTPCPRPRPYRRRDAHRPTKGLGTGWSPFSSPSFRLSALIHLFFFCFLLVLISLFVSSSLFLFFIIIFLISLLSVSFLP